MSDFDPTNYLPREPEGGAFNLLPGDLPPDIEEVWGEGRVTASGGLAADIAREMIADLGEDGFRLSALHRAALDERVRETRLSVIRDEFVKAHQKKEKVK